MPKFSEDVSKIAGEIISFLRGKKADANLVLQDSQKTALYQIRDLLFKPETELEKLLMWNLNEIDISTVLPVDVEKIYPPKGFSICITNMMFSTNTDCQASLRFGLNNIFPAWNIVHSWMYFAERGGAYIHYGRSTPLIVPVDQGIALYYWNTPNAADRLSFFMNYYFKVIEPPMS